MVKLGDIIIGSDKLKDVRKALYEDSQPGYYIFKNFLSGKEVNYLLDFWLKKVDQKDFSSFVEKHFYVKSPNLHMEAGPPLDKTVYFNFFWNKPVDEFTHDLAFRVCVMRNIVEQNYSFEEFFPKEGRATQYRMVITRNGNNLVRYHKEWALQGDDTSRTQMTLFLTEYGKDYSGKGFIFETNQGKKVSFGKDVKVSPGDLVIWKSHNLHAVQDVATKDGKMGFVRMLFPPEVSTLDSNKKTRAKEMVVRGLRKNSLMKNHIIPFMHSRKK